MSSSSALGHDQDLGDDFTFESDPQALQSILNHRGLTPKLKPITPLAGCGLTPAGHLPKRLQRFEDKFEFFEGKNGAFLYRPSAKFSGGKGLAHSGRLPTAQGGSAAKTLAFHRGIVSKPPRRITQGAWPAKSPALAAGSNSLSSRSVSLAQPISLLPCWN